jgi:hypothetical protein
MEQHSSEMNSYDFGNIDDMDPSLGIVIMIIIITIIIMMIIMIIIIINIIKLMDLELYMNEKYLSK